MNKELMDAVTKELNELSGKGDYNDPYNDGWNSPRMRMFIVAKLVSYKERCTELENQLKFEKAVGERVVKVFKDAVGSEESSS